MVDTEDNLIVSEEGLPPHMDGQVARPDLSDN